MLAQLSMGVRGSVRARRAGCTLRPPAQHPRRGTARTPGNVTPPSTPAPPQLGDDEVYAALHGAAVEWCRQNFDRAVAYRQAVARLRQGYVSGGPQTEDYPQAPDFLRLAERVLDEVITDGLPGPVIR
jgi:hypothetical protein